MAEVVDLCPRNGFASLSTVGERASRRDQLREIIFEAETPAGRAFDTILLVLILVSVLAVMLESVAGIKARIGSELDWIEWILTGIFTVEYVVRLATSRKPSTYARSFYGVVDLVSVLPSYIELLLPGGQALMVVRVLRLLRIFRVFKMARHVKGADVLMRALFASRQKITVFFLALLMIALIAGTLMYLIEGRSGDMTSIPVSVYWAIVTLTTVGYGDFTPSTPAGQFLTSLLSLMGYAIIAVPTGIVVREMNRTRGDTSSDACPSCGVHGHLPDARFCRRCGERLH